MAETNQTTIETQDQFKDDAAGQAERWSAEMQASDKEVDKWLKEGQRIVDRFLDKRSQAMQRDKTRLNLFNSNVTTVRSMLYGQIPAVDVKRRFDDQNDDVARAAATIMERLLNNDMRRDDDSYREALRYALDDYLIPGLGAGRVRYEAEFEEVEVPAMEGVGADGQPVELAPAYTEERKVWEEAPIDYVGWRDVRWSPARVWSELRWIGFRAYLTQDQVAKRFGEKVAKAIPYEEGKGNRRSRNNVADAMEFDAWKRAGVWEIWSKDDGKVYWWIKGYGKVLDVKPDPLELEGFWPCPKFMIANETTSSLVPRAHFTIHRDLYNEIDFVSTRIERLERAVKAVGVYDMAATGVQRMMEEGTDNDLIPVDNWAGFSEQGGLQGTVQWMPLGDIVAAMDKLREYRRELIELLNQASGMNDIMRGASSQPNVTATEQGLKARYASVRVTALQDQFAEFASDLQKLRAQVIVKHFDDETIVQRSNILSTPDANLVGPAMQLLRSEFAQYKVEILPDNIARADYAALKSERTEFLTAVGGFISQALPLAQGSPEAGPALVEMIRWTAAGFRGGQQVETVLDQMLDKMMQAQKQQQGQEQPDPEAQKEQAAMQRQQLRIQEQQLKGQQKLQEITAKHQADMAKLQDEQQNEMVRIQAELAADMEREAAQAAFNIDEVEAKSDADAERIRLEARYAQRP